MLNYRIPNILTFLVMIISTPALCHAELVHVSSLTDARISDLLDELDPHDTEDCFSLGELDIVFRTDEDALPNVGVVVTDPRGRRIGFDPITKRAWDALPVAQGSIDIIARQMTAYSVTISARSKEVLDGHSLQSCRSEADLQNVAIRARSRNIVLLNYSRDGREKVTAQLQHPPHTQNYEAHFHRHPDVTARK